MRVIIADDELHVRQRLQKKIDWNSLGVRDLVICSDGDEILEALGEKEADLIITDIRMPRKDGIEVVRQIRKNYPHLPVILMSAYDDKEYLKSGLRLHVLGYLEKPFSIDTAQELLQRTLTGIRKEKQENAAVSLALMRQKKTSMEELAAGFCRFRTDYSELEIQLREEYPEFWEAAGYYALILRRREEEELDTEDSLNAALSVLEEQQWCCLCVRKGKEGMTVFLACTRDELKSRIERMMTSLPVKCKGWMIACGSFAANLSHLYRSYQDAVITMERHFYHSSPVLFFQKNQTEPFSFPADLPDGFIYALRSHNALACVSYLENLRRTVLEHDSTLVRVVKNYYFQLALLILENRADKERHTVSEYYLWELFYQAGSLDDLHGFLIELLGACIPGAQVVWREQEQISSILEYIDSHLSSPGLSLTEISRAYYMSVTYLCMYFKEKTGTTIRAYIINSRMKRAAELLKLTDLKVVEVAEAVGFTDQGYFTKSFSRYFGRSPSRYKEEFHGEGT